jgi:hypothetical protein
VIHAWCIWCLVNDVLIVPALAILGVLRLRETERPTSSAPGAAPSV